MLNFVGEGNKTHVYSLNGKCHDLKHYMSTVTGVILMGTWGKYFLS